ncbi:MAG: hypothetical protein ACO1OC_02085 [Tuberibacillus sp.]
MNTSLKVADEVAKLLNQWYIQIQQNKLEEGNSTKKAVEGLMAGIDSENHLRDYFSLLEHEQQKDEECSNTDDSHRLLQFYFHFYKGTLAFNIRAYEEALECYQDAEKYLENVPDELEKAEFYYKMAASCYFLYKNQRSLQLAKKALAIFEKDPKSVKRTAHSYVALALNYIDLKEFTYAEDFLALAWATAVYDNDFELQYMICHNLGLLYRKKEDISTSIKWLLESMKYSEPDAQVYYLLAEAACLLNQKGNAKGWIESGMKISINKGYIDYIHRFRVLKVLYWEAQSWEKERVLKEAIDIFMQEGQWGNVVDRIPYLIDLYLKKGCAKEADEYKTLLSEAKKKLIKRKNNSH